MNILSLKLDETPIHILNVQLHIINLITLNFLSGSAPVFAAIHREHVVRSVESLMGRHSRGFGVATKHDVRTRSYTLPYIEVLSFVTSCRGPGHRSAGRIEPCYAAIHIGVRPSFISVPLAVPPPPHALDWSAFCSAST